MRTVQRLSDRILRRFVPTVDASAIYVWQYICVSNPVCQQNGHNYNSYLYCYCHDGSGECVSCQFVSCC